MHRVDRWLIEWAQDQINRTADSNLSGINVVEKLLRDPGMATGKSQDKILYWHRNPRIAKISKAMHQIDATSQLILVIHYGFLPKEDGNKFTLQDLAKNSSLTLGEISAKRRDSRRKVQYEINSDRKK